VDGPAGQPGEDVRSRAVRVSSGVIARAQIPDLRCLGTTVLAITTKTGFAPDKVAQVSFCFDFRLNILFRFSCKTHTCVAHCAHFDFSKYNKYNIIII